LLLIVFGGLAQLTRISVLKGTYNQRIEVIASFVDRLDSAATPVPFGPNRLAPGVLQPDSEDSVAGQRRHAVRRHLRSRPPLHPPRCMPLYRSSGGGRKRCSASWARDDEMTSSFGFVQNVLAGKEPGDDVLLRPVIDFE